MGPGRVGFDPVVLEALLRAFEKGTLAQVRIPPMATRIEEPDSEIDNIYGHVLTSIPSLPPVLTTISQLLDDPEASLREIARILSSDEGLASRVLRLVNSAYYGMPRRISTIPLAMTILGAKAVKNHVINIALADMMGGLSGGLKGFNILWAHALKTATWARLLATRAAKTDSDEAFTAGLVHDIGKALALRLKPSDYSRVVIESAGSGKEMRGVEVQVMGFDHTRLGAWLAAKWGLPHTLVSSIRWHHDPEQVSSEDESVRELVIVIYIADLIARACERGECDIEAMLSREVEAWIVNVLPSGFFENMAEIAREAEEREKAVEESFASSGITIA